MVLLKSKLVIKMSSKMSRPKPSKDPAPPTTADADLLLNLQGAGLALLQQAAASQAPPVHQTIHGASGAPTSGPPRANQH